MKKKLLFCLFTLCFHVLFTQTAFKDYVDGQVYIKFKPGALKSIYKENPDNISLSTLGAFKELFNIYGVTKASRPFYKADDDKNLPDIIKLEFLQVHAVSSFIAALAKIKVVEYAEKIPLMKTTATPNDFSISTASVYLNQINAPNAWNVFNGNSNITVAIVDNGVMWTHVDLVANTYTNTGEIAANGIDDDANGYVDDVNGYDVADNDNNPIPLSTGMFHGTHCAGIAGATNNNGIGVASIGWNIKLIPVKCQPDNGTSFGISYGFEGIIYAVKAKARVISCSWGGSGVSVTQQAIVNYAWNHGCVAVFSAGNNNNNAMTYPAACNNAYAVAAVTPSDIKSSISSYGSWVDISAPGDDIYSTMPYTSLPAYQTFSGTSEATPMVAGLAALMLSKSPNMTNADVLNCISSTAQNIYTISGNSAYVTGSQLGAGRIDAYQAMLCAASYSALPPIANFFAFPLNSCPNTPVAFSDSSLYAPTGWSWVFQGGTPATSTSSNPSVQWSAPGTYSAALTVSNTNGSNTKTKVSYITITTPGALPFAEGFETNTFLPAGWTPNNISNDEMFWQHKTGLGGFGTSTACAMFDNFTYDVPGDRDEIRSPRFNFSNVAAASLKFDVAYARYDAVNSDSLQVKLSNDCGISWTSIYLRGGATFTTAADQMTAFMPAPSQWRTDVINISALVAGQGNVMFSFVNRGHYGQAIYLDNINIVTPTPTLNVAAPSSVCAGSTVTFTNTSISAASYSWNFSGASLASSTATNPVVSYANAGTYTLSLLGSNGNTNTVITKTITVYNIPTLSLSVNQVTACSGSPANFTASGANSYSWSNGATGSSVSFSPMATTVYTLTGTNGGICASAITATVFVTTTPTVAVNSLTVCQGNTVTLLATGATTYSWSTGVSGSSVAVNPGATTSYSVTGTNGSCSSMAVAAVTVMPVPVSVISATGSACASSCNGIVNAVTQSTAGPVTYSLSASACTALPCTNLCAGTYILHTTDALGCMAANVFTITALPVLSSVVSITNAACSSCADGILSATASGGTGPYTYTWLPTGGNAATASHLVPGCYTLTINDGGSCAVSETTCVSFGTGLQNNMISQSSLLVYPNPAQNMVTIAYQNAHFDYTVYNNLGQVILQSKNIDSITALDFTGFASGIYLVEVKTGKEQVMKKIIIE